MWIGCAPIQYARPSVDPLFFLIDDFLQRRDFSTLADQMTAVSTAVTALAGQVTTLDGKVVALDTKVTGLEDSVAEIGHVVEVNGAGSQLITAFYSTRRSVSQGTYRGSEKHMPILAGMNGYNHGYSTMPSLPSSVGTVFPAGSIDYFSFSLGFGAI